jgi:uncharacterized membrane protein
LSDVKVLGGIGALLVLLAAVPNVGWLLGIAGLVLVLLAIRKISQAVSDRSIYTNMRNAVILGIGAIGVAAVTVAGAIYKVLGMGSLSGTGFAFSPNIPVQQFFGLALIVVAGLVSIWVILVCSALFVRRSYNSIASKLNVNMFKTAGLLYLIGAATAVIGVGLLLIFVSQILLAIAFFSIQDQPGTTEWQTVPARN